MNRPFYSCFSSRLINRVFTQFHLVFVCACGLIESVDEERSQ